MNWIESETIPAACRDCAEEDCYNCDAAGERWRLSQVDELKVRRKRLVNAIERLQCKIDAIDTELLPFSDEQRAALEGRAEMTYDRFWECLQVCFDYGNMAMYRSIWNAYPNFSKNIRQHMEISCE